MGFTHITAEQLDKSVTTLIAALSKKLARHAESIQVLELRRQNGKDGYKPCDNRWEDDGADTTVADEEGKVLLICGVTPDDLARRIVEAAIHHVEETGERRNYRVYGLQTAEDGSDMTEVCQHLIPQTIFSEGSSGQVTGGEHHDSLMATFGQLMRQNDKLFAMMMQILSQYPGLMGKITELIEQLGDSLSGRDGNNAEALLKVLEYESAREQRWMAHEAAKSSGHDRAQLLEKMMELAGPDVIAFVKELIRDLREKSASKAESKRGQPEPEAEPKPESALAAQLSKIFDGVPPGGIAKARLALSADEWSLIEAARKAQTDDEFREIFTKLEQLWRARGEDEVKVMQTALIEAIGMPAAVQLMRLIKTSTTR